ncbi:ankyrin, partial [Schizophyllum commune H4-8]|uniref:ankyrin n=1 Tax=Schizophyllum commune (strain H4-8 / FGSC 9210) TaxID=578458 RepID=UPI00215FE886
GWSALHFAADKGHLAVITALVAKDGDVNKRSNDEMTPLHCAAKKVHPDAIRLLCKHGADLDAMDRWGKSPLRLAIFWRERDSVEALMRARRCPFTPKYADAEVVASGKWEGVPEDSERDAAIRDMLQRKWPVETQRGGP